MLALDGQHQFTFPRPDEAPKEGSDVDLVEPFELALRPRTADRERTFRDRYATLRQLAPSETSTEQRQKGEVGLGTKVNRGRDPALA